MQQPIQKIWAPIILFHVLISTERFFVIYENINLMFVATVTVLFKKITEKCAFLKITIVHTKIKR